MTRFGAILSTGDPRHDASYKDLLQIYHGSWVLPENSTHSFAADLARVGFRR